MSKEKRQARRNKIAVFFAGVPTLTRFLITSMTAIIVYTAVLLWLRVRFDFWIDTEFSKLWYGYWGSEIFICAGLKTGKWIVTRTNPFTGQGTNSNGGDAVG